jgi:hypothetical protein
VKVTTLLLHYNSPESVQRTLNNLLIIVNNNACRAVMLGARYYCQILMKFAGQIFEKYSKTKFHENLSGDSPDVSYGLTDMK